MNINAFPLKWGTGWIIYGSYNYKYYKKVYFGNNYKDSIKKFYNHIHRRDNE